MFESISKHLANIELRSPELEILKRNAVSYQTLLLQLQENIEVGHDFIRIQNRDRAVSKFRGFFGFATDNNVDLAISPEYSCPWNNLSEIIQQNSFPQVGKLWVLGCESLKAAEFRDFVVQNNSVVWVYDNELILRNIANNQQFLNPLCYVFKTRNAGNRQIRNVIIVQFKTHPMGGADGAFEQQKMIRGNSIYVLQNAGRTTRLIALNCSDVANNLDFSQAEGFDDSPYLILHIQLNKAPHNYDFRHYRGEILRRDPNNREFICLNWARNTKIANGFANEFGGSALYLKTQRRFHDEEINVTDERLINNHFYGLYYTWWVDKRTTVYYLNYDEGLFLYRNIKVNQDDEQPAHIVKRTGPEMLATLKWNNQDASWRPNASIDGFASTCNSMHGHNFASILNCYTTNPIDAERLVFLSVGKGIYKNWHLPPQNKFFQIDNNEISHRITFTQYPCADCDADRRRYLLQFHILDQQIITVATNIPDSIADLRNNCQISYRNGAYHGNYLLNIYPTGNTGSPATGAYIGESTNDTTQDILNKMIDLFKEDNFGKRVVVWYRDNHGNLVPAFNPDKPKITDNSEASTRSIKRTRK